MMAKNRGAKGRERRVRSGGPKASAVKKGRKAPTAGRR